MHQKSTIIIYLPEVGDFICQFRKIVMMTVTIGQTMSSTSTRTFADTHTGSMGGSGQKSEDLMRRNLSCFVTDEAGVTAIEYGLIAALIAVIIIGAVSNLGTSLSTTFSSVAASL